MAPIRVLFTGHAPVHFVCFRPLYERLVARPDFEVMLSGGLRTPPPVEGGLPTYDSSALYAQFGVDPARVLAATDLPEQDFDVLFGANTNILAPRSARMRVQMFHGVSFRNKAIRRDNLGHDHYFLIGPYMRRHFVESGLMAADDPRGIDVGFLKTDRLVDRSLDRGELLRRFGLSGERPVVLYAPTGQRYNSLETIGLEVLRRLGAADRFDVLIKLHDHPKDAGIDWGTMLAPFLGPHVRLLGELDVIPLLAVADLLITDASSVSSEYSLVDRPMVFLDVPVLIAKAQSEPESAVDLETWGRRAGALVREPAEVVDAVADELAHPDRHGEVRRAMARDLFYNPGRATDAAMRWLLERLAS